MPIGSTPNETAARIVRAVADPSITAAVREAAMTTGTQFDLLMASAKIESGFRPDARAGTSSATGLFQFTEQTWLNAIRTHGPQHGLDVEAGAVVNRGGRLTVDDAGQRQRILALRSDPRVASAMAGNHLREIADKLESGLGRTPEAAEIYLGHFLGSAGARRMLSAPESQAAASILPDAARANSTLFYSQDGSALSVRTFLQRIRDKVGQAFSDIGAAMPISGFVASYTAKHAVACAVACLRGEAVPEGVYFNTCYSHVGDDYGISIVGVYRATDTAIAEVPNSGGVSPRGDLPDQRRLEAA